MRALIVLLAVFAFAGPAVAAGDIVPLTRVDAVYPEAAEDAGIQGTATVVLTVAPDGAVTAAEILDETPAGHGFGEAARVAGLKWTFAAGKGGRVSVSMVFAFDPEAAGPSHAAENATGLPIAPEPLKRGRLVYPPEAGIRNENGTVILTITIESDGTVSAAEIFSEKPRERGFGRAARKAILDSVFPAGIAGRYAYPIFFGVYNESEVPKEARRRSLPPAPAPVTSAGPDYPEEALAKGVSGSVTLAIVILEDGTVDRADIVVETPAGEDFGRNAKRAVMDWTFPVGTARGAYYVTIPFDLPAR